MNDIEKEAEDQTKVSTHDTSGLSFNPDRAFSMLPPTGKSIHIKEYLYNAFVSKHCLPLS